MFWQMVSAIAAVVYVLAFLWTVTYVRNQLIEMKKAGQMEAKAGQTEAALRVLEYINETETRRSRWVVFQQAETLRDIINRMAKTNSWETIDDVVFQSLHGPDGQGIEFRQVELSLKILDNVACLINEGYAPREVVLDKLLKNEFIRWWFTFGPYILYRREQLNDEDALSELPPEFQPQWRKMVYCWQLQTLVASTVGKKTNEIRPVEVAPRLSAT